MTEKTSDRTYQVLSISSHRVDFLHDQESMDRKTLIFDVLLRIYDFYLGILFGSMRQWYRLCYYRNYIMPLHILLWFIGQKIDVAIVHKGW